MKKILIITTLLVTILLSPKAYAEGDDTSCTTFINQLHKNTDFNMFYDYFYLEGKIGYCDGGKELKTYNWNPKTAIGFSMGLIEPVHVAETAHKPWYITMLDLDLGDSMGEAVTGGKTSYLEFATSQQHKEAEATPFRQSDDFRFPLLGLIFKQATSFLCFDQAKLGPQHMGKLNPMYSNDMVAYKFSPLELMVLNPEMMLASILDAIATTISDMTDNKQETDTVDLIRNSMFWSNGNVIGNSGSLTGWTPGSNDAIGQQMQTLIKRMDNLLYLGGFGSTKSFGMMKSSNAVFSAGKNIPANTSSMCAEKEFQMIIKSEIKPQMAYPGVGTGHELGATPANVSSFKNLPCSKNNSVYWQWKKREYYAGAYACGGSESSYE